MEFLTVMVIMGMGIVGTLAILAIVIAIMKMGNNNDSFHVSVKGNGYHGINAATSFLGKITD